MRVRQARRTERGAVMPIVAISLVALMAAAAISVDLGNGWQTRRGLITATDASALAAAQSYGDSNTPADGCANAAPAYLTSNEPTAVLDGCTTGTIGSGGNAGWVEVQATETASVYFAGILGFNDYPVTSSSTAMWGPLSEYTGLRPFGLCLAGSTALQNWIANPVGTSTITILYNKDQPDACGSDMPGNWGTIDFDGGANSNNDTKDWVLNGYPDGVVMEDHIVTSCSGGEAHCYEGDTGALAGLQSQINTIMNNNVVFTTPVFNFGENPGANALFHLVGAIQVQILDYKVTGPEADRYFTFEVSAGLVSGTCCGGGAIDTGLRAIKICGVEPNDQSGCTLS